MIRREDSAVRPRTLAGAGGREARVWIERGSRVSFHTERPNGGGTAYWDGCSANNCVGAAAAPSQLCLRHASTAERLEHTRLAFGSSGRVPLLLSGVTITPELWDFVLSKASHDDRRFTAPLHAVGANFPFKLRLSDWTFEWSASLTGAVLEDGCEITGCTFTDHVDLDFVDFRNGPGYWRQCSFKRGLSVSYGHTSQHVAFVGCEIGADLTAQGFVADFHLDDCEVAGACDLSGSAFTLLSLSKSRIVGDLGLADLEALTVRAPGIELESASRLGPVRIKGAIDLSNAKFTNRILLDVAAEKVELSGATFRAGGRLHISSAEIALDRLLLNGPVTLSGRNGASVRSIRSADAAKLVLGSVDLSCCIFQGSHGLDSLVLEPTAVLPRSPRPLRTRRRCIADEYVWRRANARWRRSDWDLAQRDMSNADVAVELGAGEVAATYRLLRRSVESQANEPGAADFYYGEMEMRRLDRGAGGVERGILW